jgi:hypothetical protein
MILLRSGFKTSELQILGIRRNNKPSRGAALSDLTFIGLSLFGFGIIFVLGLVLPRIKIKRSNNSITQNPASPKRVYKI